MVLIIQLIWVYSFYDRSRSRYIVVRPFFERGKIVFFQKFCYLRFCGATFGDVIVRTRKSTCCLSEWHLAMVIFNPAFQIGSKTALNFSLSAGGHSPTYKSHKHFLRIGMVWLLPRSFLSFSKMKTSSWVSCRSRLFRQPSVWLPIRIRRFTTSQL